MRYILLTAIFCFSLIANAKSGDMGGGRSMTVKIPNSLIEAVISKNGIYARLDDIREGFEYFEGVKVTPTETLINFDKSSILDVQSIILQNGKELQLQKFRAKVSGGDMGGG